MENLELENRSWMLEELRRSTASWADSLEPVKLFLRLRNRREKSGLSMVAVDWESSVELLKECCNPNKGDRNSLSRWNPMIHKLIHNNLRLREDSNP